MADVAELGIKITTDGVMSATQELDNLEKQGKKTETQTKNLGTAAKNNVTPFKMMKGGATQVSYQLQDVAVQAQMGTSAFTILAQQGPQLASVFGPGGAVAGAVIAFGAILAGALYNSLTGTGEAMKALQEDMKDLESNFDNLGEAAKTYVRSLVTARVAEYDKALAELNEEKRSGIKVTYDGFLAQAKETESQEDFAERMQINATEIERLTFLREEAIKSIDATTDATESLINKLKEEAETLGMTKREIALYKVGTDESQAANRAAINTLYDKIEAHEAEQQAIKDTANLNKEMVANEERLQSLFLRLNEQKAKADETAKQNDIKREEDLFGAIAKINDRKIAEEQRVQDAKDQIQNYALASASNMVGQLGAIAEEGSNAQKALFAIQKAIAIAQIIVSTEQAAALASAYVAGAGPLAWLASVQGIRAMGYASAGIVAGTAIAGGRALGGQVRGGESYLVGERGPELLTMGTSGRIATNENLKRAVGGESVSGDRNINVSFNIQANDTKGFDQLLNSRRGQIVSMINQAVNDRGRASIA